MAEGRDTCFGRGLCLRPFARSRRDQRGARRRRQSPRQRPPSVEHLRLQLLPAASAGVGCKGCGTRQWRRRYGQRHQTSQRIRDHARRAERGLAPGVHLRHPQHRLAERSRAQIRDRVLLGSRRGQPRRSKRFFARRHAMPTQAQASRSSRSGTISTPSPAGTDEARAVMAKMREIPVNDSYVKNGRLREDGRLVHDMYFAQVKKPSRSKDPSGGKRFWTITTFSALSPAQLPFARWSKAVARWRGGNPSRRNLVRSIPPISTERTNATSSSSRDSHGRSLCRHLTNASDKRHDHTISSQF